MELNRFNQLLESTMGNVKPLISEQGPPFAKGMGPTTTTTTPVGVNPSIKKPNLQPTFAIGDIFKRAEVSYGGPLKFKITPNENGIYYGTVLEVSGVWEEEQYPSRLYPPCKTPKVGDPIKLEFEPPNEFSFYLPKSYCGNLGGQLSKLQKLN